MIFYVIDVVKAKTENLTDEEQLLGEQLYLHGDLLRGATTNWVTMKLYYEYIDGLFGKYIELGTYKYERATSYDQYEDGKDRISDEIISSISLSLYNNDIYPGEDRMVATMPILMKFETDYSGETFVVSSAMNDLFTEYYFSDMEKQPVYSFLIVFSELAKYVPAFRENSDLVKLNKFISKGLVDFFSDYYYNRSGYYLDPVYLVKILIETRAFL